MAIGPLLPVALKSLDECPDPTYMNSASAPGLKAPADVRHLCCTMTSVLLRLTEESAGRVAVDELLRVADAEHDAAFLSDPDNWISLDEAVSLLETAQEITGDRLLARRVGEQTVRQHAGTQVATLLRSLGSPEAILTNITLAAGKFTTVTEMAAIEIAPGEAVITSRSRPGFVRHKALCQWATGLISQAPVLFGLPPAHIDETECQAEGGRHCSYTVTWDATDAAEAADPANHVTALEAQLQAMSKRLHNVYETAGDLLSPDELDVVLARIVERAASAVRAPAYVLAVRTAPTSDLRVYCDGLEQEEARAIGESADSDDGVEVRGVVATVASGRRAYGHLIALNAEGAEFFPQERELLELYAKHAAAVLDMATALEESAQRHRDVSALLSLTESLARAATSQDVAARIAAALPAVLSCDHAAVYGWDENANALEEIHGSPPGVIADTSLLDDLRSSSQPRFFDAASAAPAVARFMSDGDIQAMAVVPIVTHDAFLGALIAAVGDRPERLAPCPELLERLTGVAALTAPPLQTARLIHELRHQAAHDPLTGLPNRAGFAEHISRSTDADAARASGVGLLFIDLNDFKRVNDTYGHAVGDELLCQVAERLESLVRSKDATARLGGDEFAVILEGTGSADALEAASRRVRTVLAEPFIVEGTSISVSASVGCASWPDECDGAKDLMRRADAAMYREKALAVSARTA
jgi:diguanylate cyclase (GGDEF)-like protein